MSCPRIYESYEYRMVGAVCWMHATKYNLCPARKEDIEKNKEREILAGPAHLIILFRILIY